MAAEYLKADPELFAPVSELGIVKPELYEKLAEKAFDNIVLGED